MIVRLFINSSEMTNPIELKFWVMIHLGMHIHIFWFKKTSKLDQPFANDTNNTTPYNFVVGQPLVLLNLEIIYIDISISSITDSLVIAKSRT